MAELEKEPIYLPVLITALLAKVDGSIKITLETRELSAHNSAKVFTLRGREAWAVFSPDEMEQVQLPDEKPDASIGKKTQSQRLRNVLYKLWEQSRSGVDFESYYRMKMESIIEQMKGKIN